MSLLSVESISISFGGIKAVDEVSFDVAAGEIFSMIGPNGAGKTTLFNLISRIYDASGGRLLFREEDITHVPPYAIAGRGIARTFQNIELFEAASVLQNLLVGRHVHRSSTFLQELFFTSRVARLEVENRERVERIIDLLDLQRYRDLSVGELPYGVRKVVEIGRALSIGPRLILLDEPSSGLNVEETEDLAFWIQDIRDELEVTVIMVEHDMSLVAAVSDRVLALNQGRVLALGSVHEVQNHPEVARAYLGA
jgi:branched-chain amino acid transport system ATP-binding protein